MKNPMQDASTAPRPPPAAYLCMFVGMVVLGLGIPAGLVYVVVRLLRFWGLVG